MAARLRKPSTCQICRHPERQRIEALKASGASLDALAGKFGVHRDAIWRHWREHVHADLKLSYLAGAGTIEQLKLKAAEEGGAIIDYLSVLRSILMGAITASAEAQSATTLAMLSGRLIEVLREIGKITGEIERMSPSISITNNLAIMSDPRMIELQSGLLQIARSHPAARADLIALLRGLEAGPAGGAGGLLSRGGSNEAVAPDPGSYGLPMTPGAGPPTIDAEAVHVA